MAEGGALRELMVMLGFAVDQSGVRNVERAVDGIKGKLEKLSEIAEGVLAAFAVEKIGEFLVSTAENAERTALAAEKLGMGVEQFQKLGYAANQVGISAEQAAHGFTFLQRAMAGSADGSKEQAAAFEQLGIHVKDADGKTRDTNEVFGEVADKFHAMTDPAKKAQLSFKLFGRAGAELIPLLNKGGEAIRQFGEDAEALGAVQDESFFETAERFMSVFKAIKAAIRGLLNTAAKPLLDVFGKVMEHLVGWYKQNQRLLTQGVSAWFQALADVLGVVAQFLEPVVALIGFIIGGFAQLNPWVVALTVAGVALVLAWSPLLVLFGLIGLIIEDVYGYFTGKESLTGDLVKSLKDLWATLGLSLPKNGFIGFLIDLMSTGLPLLKSTIEDILLLFGALLSKPSELPSVFKHILGDIGEQGSNWITGVGGVLKQAPSQIFGGGAGAESATSNSSTVAPTTNITVHAQTNASPADIAGAVSSAMDEHHDKNMRAAYSALTPAAQ